MTLEDMLLAEKQVAPLPPWRAVDAGGMIRWRAPLLIDGAVVEGLTLHGRTRAAEPGRDVSFTLEHAPAGGRSARIDRIDWRPITPHNNQGVGPIEWRFKQFQSTHRHVYYENLKADGTLRTGNLPIALPIEEEPKTFGSLVDFVAETYSIKGFNFLAPPPWSEDLFG